MRPGWHDAQPNMDLHCVIEVSSFRLCWQMDILYNVFGSNAHRQTACAQGSVEMRGDAGGADRKISEAVMCLVKVNAHVEFLHDNSEFRQ